MVDRLAVFRRVALNRDIDRSAREFKTTTSEISHIIRSLESDIGAPIFRNDVSGLYLTDIGRAFFERTAALDGEYERLCNEISQKFAEKQTSLQIGWISALVGCEYRHAIESLCNILPGVEADITVRSSAELRYLLESGGLDVIIDLLQDGISSEYTSLPIAELPVYILMSPSDKLAQQTCVKINQLKYYPYIIAAGRGYKDAESEFVRQNLKVESCIHHVGSVAEAKEAVRAGLGYFAVCGRPNSPSLAKDIACLPLYSDSDPMRVRISAIYKDSKKLGIISELYGCLIKEFNEPDKKDF